MADIIGKIENLEGSFFVKDTEGNLRELKSGDIVYANEIIIPNTNNALSVTLSIAPIDGSSLLIINSAKEQLLDKSLLNEDFNNKELSFNQESILDALILNNQDFQNKEESFSKSPEVDGTASDTDTGLRQRKFAGNDGDYGQENRQEVQSDNFVTLDGDRTDVISDSFSSEIMTGSFATRDGASTDVVSDLRKAEWSGLFDELKYNGQETIIESESKGTTAVISQETIIESESESKVQTDISLTVQETIIKILAADSNGDPFTDSYGNYKETNIDVEGSAIYYVALAFNPNSTVFNNTTRLATQEGTVDFIFTNGTASSTDYIPDTNITTINLGSVVSTVITDDYISDFGENFTVVVNNFIPTATSNYGETTISNSNVKTTIVDNTGKPADLSKGATYEDDSEDTIVKLIALDTNGDAILDTEGNYTFVNSTTEGNVSQYKALAFDYLNTTFASGSELSIQLGSVKVSTGDNTTTSGNDYTALSTTTVALNTAFSVTTTADNILDEGETYTLSIDYYVAPTSGDAYENVSASGSVTTTITNTTGDTIIKLIALDANGDAILDSGNYTFVNSASEGDAVYYKALAFDSLETTFAKDSELSNQIGSVTVSSSDATATRGDDYTELSTTTVALGTTFSTTTLDDNISDDTETYTVNIDSYIAPTSGDTYEDVSTAGTVTTTINDNTTSFVESDSEDTIIRLIAVDSSGDAILDTDGNYTFVNSTTEGGSVYYKALAFDASEITFASGSELSNQLGSVTVSSSDNNSAQVSGIDATAGTDYTTKSSTTVALGIAFSIVTTDDFIVDDGETYTVNIDDYTAPTTGDTYENVTYNGTVTSTILDGITLGTPVNASVDEDGLSDGTSSNTATQSLGITANSDDYTVSFDTSMDVTTRTSGGNAITYAFTDDDTLLTAIDSIGTVVFTVQINSDDTYTYTLLETMIHDVDTTTAENDFDLSFDFTVTSDGTTSPIQTFDVNVTDSVPTNSPDVTAETTEDTSVTIVLSDDSFTDGKVTINGNVIISGGTATVYDPNDSSVVAGTLTNNGDGSLTFEPIADYSNYDATPTFTYGVTDLDGDSGEGTVSITINPVADAPTVTVDDVTDGLEDAESTQTTGNTNEGTNSIALALTLPTLSTDQTDENTTSTGDNPELLGYIEFTFTNGADVTDAVVEKADGTDLFTVTSDDQVQQIVIVDANGDVDYTYHHSSILLGESGVTYLTAIEYAALQIIHSEDNDTDIDISISTTSYEVDDDGAIISDVDGATTSEDMTVEINPSTDDISLAWDTATNGTISTVDHTSTGGNNNGSNTFTFTTVGEGDYYTTPIDLASILTNTSGTDSTGDLDGSEERSYTINGIPNGTIINLGGTTVTASGGTTENSNDASAIVTFSSDSNQDADPTFTMTLPEYYSNNATDGNIITNATITLSTQDTGDDSTDTASTTKIAEVYFNIEVEAVAGEATLQIGQIVGDEDAGRSNGNLLENDYNIDEPENGIELDIIVTSDDNDFSEDYLVRIDEIPDGGSLYVFDQSLDSGNGEWVLVDETFTSTGNITVSEGSATDTWQIEINDYQDDNLPRFIPPHNSDDDYTFKVNAETIDDDSTWNIDWGTVSDKDMLVTVNEVADIPVNTDLNGYDIDGNAGSDYNLVLDESTLDSGTNSFSLSEVYQTPDDLASYDSDSETLSIIISGLEDGFSVEGASSIGSGVWTFLAFDIGDITITTPEHFSGESTFDIKYVTTEDVGDSATHDTETITIYVSPSEDDVTTVNTTIYEDGVAYTDEEGVVSTNKIDLTVTLSDTDGSESITAVKILVSSVPSGFALYSDVTFTTALTDDDGDGYYDLTYTEAQSIYAKNTTEDSADNTDSFNLTVVYTVQDTADDITDTTITSKTTTEDFTHTISVTVDAVTDTPDIAINTISTSDTDVSIYGTTVTVSAEDTTFSVPITTTSLDDDSSESVTQILISGVPSGVTVNNGTYQGYSGSISNGIWLIDTTLTDTTLDTDGASEEISFTVNAGADFANTSITITTYTQDIDDSSEELSTSVTFTLIADYTSTGGTGTPPEFELSTIPAIIYEDDNNDTNTYNLGESLSVENIGGSTSGGYAVTISGFAEGTELSGYTYSYVENSVTYYVVSGTGNAADVEAKLSLVIVTPTADENDSSESTTSMAFRASIATYDGGTFEDGNTVDYTESIAPVTDDMTITIAASDTSEDTATTVSITLTNDVDSSTTIVGDTMYIKVSEDFESGETSTGTFSYGGVVLSTTSVEIDGVTSDYYVVDITGYTLGTTLDFEYTPGDDRHGDVTFDVVVYNQEGESWTSYDTAVQTSKNSETITVNAVVDGLESGISDASGTEASNGDDNRIKIDISTVLSDTSESFGSITLDKIPNGFLIYYGDDSSSLSLASNTGTSATYTDTYDVDIYSDDDDAVTYNQWLIPLDDDGTLPDYVYIQAPDNWSGTLEDIVLNLSGITDGDSSEDVSYTFDVTFEADADDITIDPTLTFGDAFDWLDLTINANIEDVDGSETVTIILTNLDDSAQFRFDDSEYTPNATYDESTGNWTLEDVPYDEINSIQFVNDNSVSSVGVTVHTVEQSNGDIGDSVNSTFTVSITEVSGRLTLEEGISLDFSKLDDDSSFNTVTEIDLSDSGENKIENLSLEDLLSTSDGTELTITGTSEDSVSLDGNWVKETSTSGYTEYTNSDDDTVSLKIDDDITNVTIA